MKLIDFHTHIYPEPIADKATQAVRDFYEMEQGGVHGTAEFLLERGKQAGVTDFVVLPVALNPKQVRKINQNIVDQKPFDNARNNHSVVMREILELKILLGEGDWNVGPS